MLWIVNKYTVLLTFLIAIIPPLTFFKMHKLWGSTSYSLKEWFVWVIILDSISSSWLCPALL
jgi:hypothetical protein